MITSDKITITYGELLEKDCKIYELQQENQELKKQLEYIRSNEYLNQVKWERIFNEDLVKELQERIDKAINYINHTQYYGIIMPPVMSHLKGYVNGDDLLDILKGGNNE